MTELKTSEEQVLRQAAVAKSAAFELASISAEQRNEALSCAADEIEQAVNEILDANGADMRQAIQAGEQGKLSQSMISRLKLSAEKLQSVVQGVRQVASLADPLGQVSYARELDDNLRLFRVSCPIGLIGVIFESRPDALPQIASLCIKSGNGVILKGGRESINTNRALFDAICRGTAAAGIPADCLVLLDSREAVESMLRAEKYVDLIIPRGSNQLVRHIQDNTRIPVLGHADGVCHIYVDENADLQQAIGIIVDSKTQYPAACNSVETLLVHERVAVEFLPVLVPLLFQQGVEVRCDKNSQACLPADMRIRTKIATEQDWCTEYCELVISVKLVNCIDEAIKHINEFGSHHTDTIVTTSKSAFDKFFAQVDSAGVFWNASTRFADGFRYGFGAEVGISTGKLHPRGPVGLDGLVTYKYKLLGNGQIVGDYVGEAARPFTHRTLPYDC